MHIAFAASECVPFSKTGGLADVIGSLPRSLVKAGHQATVFLPRYRVTKLENPKVAIPSLTIATGGLPRFCSVLDGGKQHGVQFYCIEYPEYFDRDGIYGSARGDYPDNADRFAFFSRAVIESLKIIGKPNVLHVHDWHTALIPVLLRRLYAQDRALAALAVVLTIHNIGYQGIFPSSSVPRLGLPWSLFTIDLLEFYDRVNFLKGGIVCADLITTVSKKYAQEIQTPEYGFGLDGVVRNRGGALVGILNGVDYSEWNPEGDRFIAAHYGAENLGGKQLCRADLLQELKLADPGEDVPVLAMVSRLAAQKGFDLIAPIAEQMVQENLLLVILGTGEKRYEDLFRALERRYPDKVRARLVYDNKLAHKIEAGADMFLMPSHYEPCGLNQIYSLRYGTVPVVRATGGLDDTIQQWNGNRGSGNGFKFSGYTPQQLLLCLQPAVREFPHKQNWHKLMRNGMKQDFSWERVVPEYERAYQRAIAARI